MPPILAKKCRHFGISLNRAIAPKIPWMARATKPPPSLFQAYLWIHIVELFKNIFSDLKLQEQYTISTYHCILTLTAWGDKLM